MRALGHFCFFVGFFLVFSLMLGLLLLGVVVLRVPLATLLVLLLLPGLYAVYSRSYRAVLAQTGSRKRGPG